MSNRKDDDLELARQISLDARFKAGFADLLEKYGAQCIAEGRKQKRRRYTLKELA
jgi:hypothetical protein